MPRRTRPSTHIDRQFPLPVRKNLLLESLQPDDRQAVESRLEPIAFHLGQVLHQRGELIERVYFPESGMCSATISMQDGGTVEVGSTGYEGVVGVTAFYGIRKSPADVMVEIPGRGYAMHVADFERTLAASRAFEGTAARFARAVFVQALQLAACNRLHSVEPRLARWLLMTRDRVGAQRFPLTQQILAYMLGTQRPRVTLMAGLLQRAGSIDYHRGVITIHDQDRLEASACECYCIIRDAFAPPE